MVKKVLIVENNDSWQTILKKVLLAEGLKVTVVQDAPAALGELMRGQYHLVTIDYNLASSISDENLDGRNLLQQVDNLGIPAIVISGRLQPNEVIEDYQHYHVLRILDKAGFSKTHFRNLVRETLFTQEQTAEIMIDEDVMYKVVQTLLRNRLKRNRELATRNPIQELGKVLDRPVNTYLSQLRELFEQSFTELLGEAENEEIGLQGIDRRAFPETGHLTQTLIKSMKSGDPVLDQRQFKQIKSERMLRMFVLEALYGHSYSLKPQLMDQLAVAEGALNRLRKKGIFEIVNRLRNYWP